MRWGRRRKDAVVALRQPPKDPWEALARCVDLPLPWVAGVTAAAAASVFHITRAGGDWTVDVRLTTVTAILVGLVWLPTLLQVIALTGGNLRTPAGEASTRGLLGFFQGVPRDQQEKAISAAAAVVDQAETTAATPQERIRARQVKEELVGAIAEIPRSAQEISQRIDEIAAEYERLRASMPSGGERTRAMTELVNRARGLASSSFAAATQEVDPARLFASGRDGMRVVALAAAQARHDPRDLDIAIAAIADPRSAFEQFQALRTAAEILPLLSDAQWDALVQAIEKQMQPGGWITQADMSRWRLAQWVLAARRGRPR